MDYRLFGVMNAMNILDYPKLFQPFFMRSASTLVIYGYNTHVYTPQVLLNIVAVDP